MELVCENICIEVEQILEATQCDSYSFILSPDDRRNFRKFIYPAYKLNRKPTPKPDMYWPLAAWCRDALKGYDVAGMEGDDLIGIIHTQEPEDTVMVSSDKDLKTIPGDLYNPMHKTRYISSVNEANHYWLLQTLMGDSTDNYKGCPRIGKVKAERLLMPPDGTHPEFYLRKNWQIVLDTYRNAYASDDDALDQAVLQARLARILRVEDYDFETESIRLWHPTDSVYMQTIKI